MVVGTPARVRPASFLLLVAVLGAAVLSVPAAEARANAARSATAAISHRSPVEQASIASALRDDGTVRPGASGSFSGDGYRMKLRPDGSPSFVTAAGDENWRAGFDNPGAAYATSILAVAVAGPNVYIGGYFNRLSYDSGVITNNVAWWDGTSWHALGNGVNGTVHALAVTAAGELYAGGEFTSAGGVSAAHVARWDGAAWSDVGGGVSLTGGTASVSALAVNATSVFVGGEFTSAGSVAANSVARWNGSKWLAVGGAGIQTCYYFDTPGHCYSAPATGDVHALAVRGAQLFAGGDFNLADGSLAVGLASWSSAASWSPIGDVADAYGDGEIDALAVTDSTLYVGGKFVSVGGVEAHSVAAWNGSTWSPLGSGAQNCNGCGEPRVHSLAFRAGRLYLGGDVYGTGGNSVPGLGQWDGTTWTGVGDGLGSYYTGPVAMTVADDGVVMVGDFDASGPTTLNGIGLWNGSAWSAYGQGVSYGTNSGPVKALATDDHDVYVGGYFYQAGGSASRGIAHYNGKKWLPMAGGVSGGSAYVTAIAVSGHDVYVGGSFSQAGTVAAANIARWDGSAWHAVGSGVDSTVYALTFYQGKLWAGGNFTHAGGAFARQVAVWDPAISQWSAVGGNASFSNGVHSLAGLPAPNEHYLVIGGSFSYLGTGTGSDVRVNGLVYFDTSAAITSPLSGYYYAPGASGNTAGVTTNCGSSLCGADAMALAVVGTKVYVGGNFNNAGDVSSQGFAALDLSTGVWSSPGTVGGGTDGGRVHALIDTPDGMFLGGDFSVAGSTLAAGAARFDRQTGTFSPLGSGLSSNGYYAYPFAIAQGADGTWFGGQFGMSGAVPAENLALWTATRMPVTIKQSASPRSGTRNNPVTFTATVSNTGSKTVRGTTVRITPSAGVTITSAGASQGTCSIPKKVCTLGTLAAGATTTMTVTMVRSKAGRMQSQVKVSYTGTDFTNSARTVVQIR